ncbi:hypothetical protein Phum_PHUM496040 [Pediculus humanus corporis]|uniref:Uncharacterized protein n=1 Tax=Pediculus humanus subsp. corporis TaxID=121224 RepID=E0VX70_PEDHC|nr:uncharacterized protein Phum_PHUM496040 [Pediculus humanus corporis]EEB17976.1 hypothetical protein Phum_PHUM496040 [Pediculus humanus corporis]
MKGYFDATLEINNWMKFIRSTSGKNQNLKHFLLTGQLLSRDVIYLFLVIYVNRKMN